ncbi:hypothetical protein CS022_24470 [Veronia nyctiphanis]|uniref:Uncharacterized protein n=1 Tax=Veronia nyctiphanis TaxID=1278244 RepID=A0A4Q0Y9P4_9GAMM|nr:hypothetical protein [Veronia nyctiphanis]RXJ66942.1 hypothetical protein CS022_24470 [Veronia nyctiphanis]
MEVAKVIDTGFSTADAEYPEILQLDGDVTLRFIDWQASRIEVFFADPIAMRWQMAETLIEGEHFDRCHQIENSQWLQQHIEQGVISETESYRHYKFNFNDAGQFEVIALNYRLKT